jgi:hypothetical protein
LAHQQIKASTFRGCAKTQLSVLSSTKTWQVIQKIFNASGNYFEIRKASPFAEEGLITGLLAFGVKGLKSLLGRRANLSGRTNDNVTNRNRITSHRTVKRVA